MNAISILNVLSPFLLIGLPIFLVLRFGFRGVIYGAGVFWLLGVAWNLARWHLVGISDGSWLILGLPGGLLYGLIIWIFGGLLLKVASATGWRGRNQPISATTALIAALLLTALLWHSRPYGMGTSSMIRSLNECSPDEVMFVWNEPWYFHNRGEIDLKKGSFHIFGDDESDSEFGSITLTMNSASVQETTLGEENLWKVQRFLHSFPAEHQLFFQRYDFTQYVYVALWRNGNKEVLRYRRENLPPDVSGLFAVLGPHVLQTIESSK